MTSIAALSPTHSGRGLARGFDVFDDDLGPFPDAAWVEQRLERHLDELASVDGPFFLFVHFADPHAPVRAHGDDAPELVVRVDGEVVHSESLDGFVRLDLDLGGHAAPERIELECDTDVVIHHLALHAADGPVALDRAAVLRPARRHGATVTGDTDAKGLWLSTWVADHVDVVEARRRYGREVGYVDAAIARTHAALAGRGLLDEAVVVFTSDHGEGLGDHGYGGHGRTVFDEQIAVPLVVRPAPGDPAVANLRARANQVVSHVDVTATLLDLLDLPALPDQAGHSLARPGEEDPHFAQNHDSGGLDLLNFCLRDSERKLVLIPELERFVLFDLAADPGETVDALRRDPSLAGDPEIAEWSAWLETEVAERRRAGRADLDDPARRALEALGYVVGDDGAEAVEAAAPANPAGGD